MTSAGIYPPETEITIIPADPGQPEDGAAILALLEAYAQSPMGGGQPLTPYVHEHLLECLRQRPETVILLIRAGGHPVGLLIAFEGFSTFNCCPLLNIHDLYVADEWRGYGLAQRLLQVAEDIARRRGCCKLTLEVLEHNSVARRAYARAGFEGYQLAEENGHALFLQKSLL